jgi:TPR repeat protein
MYVDGKGVVQDYAEAVKWYRLAAAQGYADAQFNLGLMYGDGLGVLKNYKKAHMWLNLAALKGDSKSANVRKEVAKEMTAQQIGEAQAMARQCMERKFKGCD